MDHDVICTRTHTNTFEAITTAPPLPPSPAHSSLVSKLVNRCFPISISEDGNSSEFSRKKLAIFLTVCSALLFVITSLIAVFSILTFTRIGNPFDDAYIVAVLLLILEYSTLALTSPRWGLLPLPELFKPQNRGFDHPLSGVWIASDYIAGRRRVWAVLPVRTITSLDDAWICEHRYLAEVHDPFLAFICERSALLKG